MSANLDQISADIERSLRRFETKTLLRFAICGSVDDGKSTLIGRLLFEAEVLSEDQLAAVTADSKKWGTQGGAVDFALLVDGLTAEREQKITIDVAYRYFATDKRKFIVADVPGHEQYTRNMITGASTADLAVIVVDARKGVLTQTRRHSCLASLIGIRQIVLAINKMDLVNYSEEVFRTVESQYRGFAAQLSFDEITAIPLSALYGDNILEASDRLAWYLGPTLMRHLEFVEVDDQRLQRGSFRMAVQWVNRPDMDFRGFSGLVSSGKIRPGDRVRVQPSGRESNAARIVTAMGDQPLAVAGQSITLTLMDEIDVSRGDLLCGAGAPAEVADQFEATIVWMAEEPMLPGRGYLLKIGTLSLTVTIAEPKYRLNVDTMERLAAKRLALNEIGVCNLTMDRAVPFDPYTANRDTGGFIVIDRLTNDTLAAGTLHFALRRSHNIHVQPVEVNKAARAARNEQRPVVLWFTGLSGAGKSTIANLVEMRLHAMGLRTYLLDGDNVRQGLCRDLGFTDADRIENIRRVAEISRLMVDAGLVVLTALISPFRSERDMARALLNEGEFVEIFVDTPLGVAEQRDVKGLYKKARSGKLLNFTGIDSPYEAPDEPEIRVDTTVFSAEEAAAMVIERLRELRVIGAESL